MAVVLACGIPAIADEPGVVTRQGAGWFRRHFGRLTWEEIVNSSASPKDVVRLVGRRVRYEQDEGDEWSDARTVIARGYGDCEDFASTVVALCSEKGFDAKVAIFFDAEHQVGHAVAIGEWKGQQWMSSNGSFARVLSWEDAHRRLARELGVSPENLVRVSDSAAMAMNVSEGRR